MKNNHINIEKWKITPIFVLDDNIQDYSSEKKDLTDSINNDYFAIMEKHDHLLEKEDNCLDKTDKGKEVFEEEIMSQQLNEVNLSEENEETNTPPPSPADYHLDNKGIFHLRFNFSISNKQPIYTGYGFSRASSRL